MTVHVPKPCVDCGGAKERGPGKRRCASCAEARLPVWQQADRERRNALNVARRDEAREAAGRPKRVFKKDWPEGKAWCSRCKQFKPLNRFPPSYSGYCRPCNSDYNHAKRIADLYGITTDQYYEMLDSQDGACAICKQKPRTKRLAVDHNHDTNEVRGLLCKRCNHGLLGAAHDKVELLERAIEYLTNPPARAVLNG